jgi:hypothetical protein
MIDWRYRYDRIHHGGRVSLDELFDVVKKYRMTVHIKGRLKQSAFEFDRSMYGMRLHVRLYPVKGTDDIFDYTAHLEQVKFFKHAFMFITRSADFTGGNVIFSKMITE